MVSDGFALLAKEFADLESQLERRNENQNNRWRRLESHLGSSISENRHQLDESALEDSSWSSSSKTAVSVARSSQELGSAAWIRQTYGVESGSRIIDLLNFLSIPLAKWVDVFEHRNLKDLAKTVLLARYKAQELSKLCYKRTNVTVQRNANGQPVNAAGMECEVGEAQRKIELDKKEEMFGICFFISSTKIILVTLFNSARFMNFIAAVIR